MTETPGDQRSMMPSLVLASLLFLVVGGVSGFLIAHYAVDTNSPKVTTPDPQTVSCQAWSNLSVDQKKSIASKLTNIEGDSVSASDVDRDCQIDTSVSGDEVTVMDAVDQN